MTKEDVERLLNSGIPWSPKGWAKEHPQRIYNIHNGTVYRAMSTVPGRSYHGFPEDASRLPPEMKKPLLERAQRLECLEEVRKWLRS